MIQREAVLRQVIKGTLGEHRAQAGHCRDADTAGLTWERELQAEGHSEFHSLIPFTQPSSFGNIERRQSF